MKLESYHIPHTKMDSKWINNLNIRAKTIKNLGRKHREVFMTLDLAMDSVILVRTSTSSD